MFEYSTVSNNDRIYKYISDYLLALDPLKNSFDECVQSSILKGK